MKVATNMSTATRNKYRFEDRKSAEDAVTRLEQQLILSTRMINAQLKGSPLHTITVGDMMATIQTHHASGKLLVNPGMVVNSSISDMSWSCGDVTCPYQYIRNWADRSFSYDDHIGMNARDLANEVRNYLKSIGAY